MNTLTPEVKHTLLCGCVLYVSGELDICREHNGDDESATVYLNPTTREVMNWYDAGRCSWCGNNCKSGSCRARKCDSCTEIWLADSEADYREFDSGGMATVGPKLEDCPPCVAWLKTMHLDNPAASFAVAT